MTQSQCRYTNNSNGFQILIFRGLERTIYPGESIEFQATTEERIVIKDQLITSTIADTIACQQLFMRRQIEG